jgi:hypothetical protein
MSVHLYTSLYSADCVSHIHFATCQQPYNDGSSRTLGCSPCRTPVVKSFPVVPNPDAKRENRRPRRRPLSFSRPVSKRAAVARPQRRGRRTNFQTEALTCALDPSVHRSRRSRYITSCRPNSLDARIATIARITVTFDRDGRQASCPFNQLKLTRGRVARNTTVHLQRSEIFTTLSDEGYGTENMQTKERSTPRNLGSADCAVSWCKD